MHLTVLAESVFIPLKVFSIVEFIVADNLAKNLQYLCQQLPLNNPKMQIV